MSTHAGVAGMATWQVAHKGTVYPLAVAPNSATADIDATIKSMIGYAGNDMQYELADGTRVVLSSTLPDGIEVHCKPPHAAAQHVRDGEGMRLHIKTLTGKSTYVTVSKDATLDDLKAAVEAQDGCPPCQQRLIFNGNQIWDKDLDAPETLEQHGLQDGSLVHLILRLSGC